MNKTVQPRKQRKRILDAPLHTRGKRIASVLSPELKTKYNKKSIPLIVGDKVEVLRGNFKGHKDVVEEIDRKKYRVYVKGVVNKKTNGEDAPRPVNASNLRILEVKLEDKKREKMIARSNMANKGETKTLKRLAAPKVAKIQRKATKFIVRPSRGPHSSRKSIPLAVAMRDLIHIADNIKEVKTILNQGKAFVDGRVVKDHRLPVGFMDVISFPNIGKYYRVIYDEKGRLIPNEIDAKGSTFKLCKISDKTIIAGGKTQLNLHDGKNILYDKKCTVGDVIKVEIPSLNVLGTYPLTEQSMVYVTGGKHAGETASIKSITEGTMMRAPLAVLEKEGKEFETRKDYVFVIGLKEAAIKL